ncbi:MAG: hypothetical protein UX60_C0014G0002 [Berkelbacteria bacterium GW2011_GWA2_46_7]|uniref:Uncharacterized protein n=1 Tax=Berkelbacteria bacterium GW2011_GWA2_46_7 TaxID=1618335 RepID=A0A0G1SPE3_9BACT|nr:MAG: hypothetical protein UX60_C0014G0002 [Berkelbacteria bacterium GW2011_GWA2_46_7]
MNNVQILKQFRIFGFGYLGFVGYWNLVIGYYPS